MIFDEVHLAKSVYISSKKSNQGRMVMRLQYQYPNSRVVYSTATAASEVEHLQVYSRLNVWGLKTAYATAKIFRKRLLSRYVLMSETLYCAYV